MTDRERWTVYPLLFLTLGIALKDKLMGVVTIEEVRSKNLVCNALVVADAQGNQQVVVSSTSGGGLMRARGAAGNADVLVGHTPRLGGLLFADSQGKLLPRSIPAPPLPRPQPEQPANDPPAEPQPNGP